MDNMISYVAENGYKGVLYDYHKCDGECYYQMSIYDKGGYEVLHAYNARPKTYEQLKKVIDEHRFLVYFLKNIAETGSP